MPIFNIVVTGKIPSYALKTQFLLAAMVFHSVEVSQRIYEELSSHTALSKTFLQQKNFVGKSILPHSKVKRNSTKTRETIQRLKTRRFFQWKWCSKNSIYSQKSSSHKHLIADSVIGSEYLSLLQIHRRFVVFR